MEATRLEKPIEITLALGSNIGDRLQNLKSCLTAINQKVGHITKTSSIYETEPWGNPNQDKFYNMVISAHTVLGPIALLSCVKSIECDLGREPQIRRYEPRIIDIDIIYYGNAIISIKTPDLSIPHPLVQVREFVLVPLNEIQPMKTHPLLKCSNDQLLASLNDYPLIQKVTDQSHVDYIQNS